MSEPEKSDGTFDYADGWKLTPAERKIAAERVKHDPSDVRSRLLLIGFYEQRGFGNKNASRQVLRHLSWMIENKPEHVVHSLVSWTRRNDDYVEARNLWLKVARANSHNPEVLKNAAMFCREYDIKRSQRLLERAVKIRASDPSLKRELSFVYGLQAINPKSKSAKLAVQRSLDLGLKAVRQHRRGPVKDSYTTIYLEMIVTQLADLAFAYGELDFVEKLGAELANVEPEPYELPVRGQRPITRIRYRYAKHHGWSLLGRAALLSGRRQRARNYLKKMQEDAPIDTPDLALPAALLRVGDSKAVLAYLQCCANELHRFCEKIADKISASIAPTVFRSGGTPKKAAFMERAEIFESWCESLRGGQTPKLDLQLSRIF